MTRAVLKTLFTICIIFMSGNAAAQNAQHVMASTGSDILQSQASNQELETLVIHKAGSDDTHRFMVEIVDTPEARQQGLMFRDHLAEDQGMLFLFEKMAPRAFWMRNTYIPLDIIFINEGGVITHIQKDAVPMDETPLPSNGPAIAVLEVNAGLSETLGIEAGDKIEHSFFAK